MTLRPSASCGAVKATLAVLLLALATWAHAEKKIKLPHQEKLALWITGEGTVAKEGADLVFRFESVTVRNPALYPAQTGHVNEFSVFITDRTSKTRLGKSAPTLVNITVPAHEQKTWNSLEFRIPAANPDQDFRIWLTVNDTGRSYIASRGLLVPLASLNCPDVIQVTSAAGDTVRFDVDGYVKSKASKEAALEEIRRKLNESKMNETYRKILDAVACR